MRQAKFERRGKNITVFETGEVLQFPSLNKAKAESRKLQQANGGLGRGSLYVRRQHARN